MSRRLVSLALDRSAEKSNLFQISIKCLSASDLPQLRTLITELITQNKLQEFPYSWQLIQQRLVKGTHYGAFLGNKLVAVMIDVFSSEDVHQCSEILGQKLLPVEKCRNFFILAKSEFKQDTLMDKLVSQALKFEQLKGASHVVLYAPANNLALLKVAMNNSINLYNFKNSNSNPVIYLAYRNLKKSDNSSHEHSSKIWVAHNQYQDQKALFQSSYQGIQLKPISHNETLICFAKVS